MGKVSYSPGIEFVQGSLAKPKKVDGHNHGDYLIGTHRTAPTENPNCTRIYVRKGNTSRRRASQPVCASVPSRLRLTTAPKTSRRSQLTAQRSSSRRICRVARRP